jgi:hypothetical protein
LQSLFASGQTLSVSDRFTNDSVKFTTWLVQPNWDKDRYYSETVVQVTSLNSTDWQEIKLLDKEAWLKLLNDPKVDWIANLVLYQLNRKDAGLFRVIKTRDNWIASTKKDDMA